MDIVTIDTGFWILSPLLQDCHHGATNSMVPAWCQDVHRLRTGIPPHSFSPLKAVPDWAAPAVMSRHWKSCLDSSPTPNNHSPQHSFDITCPLTPAIADAQHPFLCNQRCDEVFAMGIPAWFCGSHYLKDEKSSSRLKHMFKSWQRAIPGAVGGEKGDYRAQNQ